MLHLRLCGMSSVKSAETGGAVDNLWREEMREHFSSFKKLTHLSSGLVNFQHRTLNCLKKTFLDMIVIFGYDSQFRVSNR